MASTTDNMKHQMSEPGLLVSKLPEDIQAEVGRLNLDKDADGKINSAELRDMIVELLSTKKDIKSLRKVTIGLAIYGIFLTFAIFGVSIAAARLAKDTTVDAETGNLQVKGSDGQLIRTSPVSFLVENLNMVAQKNEDLSALTDLILSGGNVEFAIKGFARSVVNNTVIVFVEGGSVLYDEAGLVSATGTAETALVLGGGYYAEDEDDDSSEEGARHRRLTHTYAHWVYGNAKANSNVKWNKNFA